VGETIEDILSSPVITWTEIHCVYVFNAPYSTQHIQYFALKKEDMLEKV